MQFDEMVDIMSRNQQLNEPLVLVRRKVWPRNIKMRYADVFRRNRFELVIKVTHKRQIVRIGYTITDADVMANDWEETI